MIDAHLLFAEMGAVVSNLAQRGYAFDERRLLTLEAERKAEQGELEALRAERNRMSKEIGAIKRDGGETAERVAEVEAINARVRVLEASLPEINRQLREMFLDMPNLLHESVPRGVGEGDNLEVRRWGTPPVFDFAVRDHVSLGEGLGGLDFSLAARLAGARFVVMRDDLARMHRALAQFMLDLHVREHGYREVYMPFLANAGTLMGTGQLPKFEEDLFATRDDGFYLIPTAEVVSTNVVADSIVAKEALPLFLVCHTPCFRREAGSYGKDTRGMLRQHQFEKVELVHVTVPDESYASLERMLGHAEAVLQALGLPYRVVSLCSGDIGFAAAKTYDIEVWLPGQEAYREISSCSNCEDFQARRMRARYRREDGKTGFLHTLNGSGVAVGRALIAVMENYQEADGGIVVPDRLRPYMGGLEKILPAA